MADHRALALGVEDSQGWALIPRVKMFPRFRETALAGRLRASIESRQNRPALAALLGHRQAAPSADIRAWFDDAAVPRIPIDISVVTYNSARWLPGFFDSLARQRYPLAGLRLIFVDHGSSDATVDILNEKRREFEPRLRGFQVFCRPNRGFGAGHDFAIAQGDAEFVLVSNADIEFDADAICRAVRVAMQDDPRTASWELRQLPYEHPKHYDPVTWETNWSSHACILLRRKAWAEAGGYDKGIFMYAEDVEYSYRLRRPGWHLRYCPIATVTHFTYAYAGELKPIQYVGSVSGNLLLRLRYGDWRDMVGAAVLAVRQLRMPQPFAGARQALIKGMAALLLRLPAILLSRRPGEAFFPFRGLDYELTREGAYVVPKALGEARPLVSIVTRASREQEDFLRQAGETVFRQTYRHIEWIVVEDGDDALRHRVAELAKRATCTVHYLSLPESGRRLAYEAGLSKAQGEYLMLLEADGLLYADHVEVLLGELLGEAGCLAASSLAWQVPTRGSPASGMAEGDYTAQRAPEPPVDSGLPLDADGITTQGVLFAKAAPADRASGEIRHLKFVPKTTALFRVPVAHP